MYATVPYLLIELERMPMRKSAVASRCLSRMTKGQRRTPSCHGRTETGRTGRKQYSRNLHHPALPTAERGRDAQQRPTTAFNRRAKASVYRALSRRTVIRCQNPKATATSRRSIGSHVHLSRREYDHSPQNTTGTKCFFTALTDYALVRRLGLERKSGGQGRGRYYPRLAWQVATYRRYT